ncbi:uncharacterized protein SCHCODRAFT_02588294 [Schizophyllum commune H4-8]|nr:uncharacterized protein SCHCODRAFT_02588294 [Schizophyllum commune H4-8]KAI5888768.1 hypothetical protein SCHCODRAFT_02588294 [Schizophyllum commune H4-8]
MGVYRCTSRTPSLASLNSGSASSILRQPSEKRVSGHRTNPYRREGKALLRKESTLLAIPGSFPRTQPQNTTSASVPSASSTTTPQDANTPLSWASLAKACLFSPPEHPVRPSATAEPVDAKPQRRETRAAKRKFYLRALATGDAKADKALERLSYPELKGRYKVLQASHSEGLIRDTHNCINRLQAELQAQQFQHSIDITKLTNANAKLRAQTEEYAEVINNSRAEISRREKAMQLLSDRIKHLEQEARRMQQEAARLLQENERLREAAAARPARNKPTQGVAKAEEFAALGKMFINHHLSWAQILNGNATATFDFDNFPWPVIPGQSADIDHVTEASLRFYYTHPIRPGPLDLSKEISKYHSDQFDNRGLKYFKDQDKKKARELATHIAQLLIILRKKMGRR